MDNKHLIKQVADERRTAVIKFLDNYTRNENLVKRRCLFEGCRYGIEGVDDEPLDYCIYCGKEREDFNGLLGFSLEDIIAELDSNAEIKARKLTKVDGDLPLVLEGSFKKRRVIEKIEKKIIEKTDWWVDLTDDGDGEYEKGEIELTGLGKKVRDLILDILKNI